MLSLDLLRRNPGW